MTGPDPLAVWAVIAVVGAGSLAFRLSFIELFGRLDEVPAGARRVLRLIPAAVLAAIVAPALLVADGGLVAPTDPALLAGVVAVVVAWRTRSVLATIVVGMAARWLLAAV